MSDRNSPSGVAIFFRDEVDIAANIIIAAGGTADTGATTYRAVRNNVSLVVTPTLQWSADTISTVLTTQVLLNGAVAGPVCTTTAAIAADVYTFSRPIFIDVGLGGVVTIGLRLTSTLGISTIIAASSSFDVDPIIGTESPNDRT